MKTLCLAKSIYGYELWNALSSNELLALERAFRFSIKNIQGLPKRTRTNICLGLTGTTSIESIIDMYKLYFLCHLQQTSTWTLVYKVVTSRLLCFKNKCVQTAFGFIPDIHRIMCKYQLLNHVTEFSDTSRLIHHVISICASWRPMSLRNSDQRRILHVSFRH